MAGERPAFRPQRPRQSLGAIPSVPVNKENTTSTSEPAPSTSTRRKRAQSLGGEQLEQARKKAKESLELSPSKKLRRGLVRPLPSCCLVHNLTPIASHRSPVVPSSAPFQPSLKAHPTRPTSLRPRSPNSTPAQTTRPTSAPSPPPPSAGALSQDKQRTTLRTMRRRGTSRRWKRRERRDRAPTTDARVLLVA